MENTKEPNERVNISERMFYRYRLALRETKKHEKHWLWFAGRLAEYFVISIENRIERKELEYVKKLQREKKYRHILAKDYINVLQDRLKKFNPNAKLGQVFLMPRTFAGSRQFYQHKYADVMTMAQNLGNPTWFV